MPLMRILKDLNSTYENTQGSELFTSRSISSHVVPILRKINVPMYLSVSSYVVLILRKVNVPIDLSVSLSACLSVLMVI